MTDTHRFLRGSPDGGEEARSDHWVWKQLAVHGLVEGHAGFGGHDGVARGHFERCARPGVQRPFKVSESSW